MTSTRLPVVCPIVSGDTDLDREWAPMGCLTDCFFTFLVVFQWSRAFHVMYVVNRKKKTLSRVSSVTPTKCKFASNNFFRGTMRDEAISCAAPPPLSDFGEGLLELFAAVLCTKTCRFGYADYPHCCVVSVFVSAGTPPHISSKNAENRIAFGACSVGLFTPSVSQPSDACADKTGKAPWMGGASRNGCGGWMERALPRPPPVCTTNHHLSQTSSGSCFVSISGGVNLRYSLKLSVVLYLMRTLE